MVTVAVGVLQQIKLGESKVVVAGGAENMSMVSEA